MEFNVLGLHISLFRQKREKDIQDVADHCGVSCGLIRDIENNKLVVRKELLKKICDCLDVPLNVRNDWFEYLDSI